MKQLIVFLTLLFSVVSLSARDSFSGVTGDEWRDTDITLHNVSGQVVKQQVVTGKRNIIDLAVPAGALHAMPLLADETAPDYAAYLFTYFTGNNQTEEQIRFAVSGDGFEFTALNDGQPVINSADIADKKAVRDPHILRCEDGETFYMVATDMKSSEGWSSNRGIILLKSSDLVNWTSAKVNIPTAFPTFGTIDRAWAPQTIYDPVAGKYMVYFSMHVPNGKDIIYYAYANSSFTALETTPQQLYFPADGNSCIDGDIIPKDGKYYLFYKTEGNGNGIRVAAAESVTGPYLLQSTDYVSQTTEAAEGSCVYKLNHSDTYVLMYDVYNKGKYEFCTSTDLKNFTLTDKGKMNFHPRHGTVLSITSEELSRLIEKWEDKCGSNH
ncbi:arabinosidase [Bacteroidia bacterium]|nr:arabinosidase [Bacteroidia bacterium]GHT48587.1 arabinosidase [Bacteroidia bacterium]